MSSSSISALQLLAAAIVLNNTGVSLIERRCYHQARDTFKDGLNIIETIIALTSSSAQEHAGPELLHQEQHASSADVQVKLRNASLRLLHQEPNVDLDSQRNNVRVISLDESETLNGMGPALQEAQNSDDSNVNAFTPTTFLIRIEMSLARLDGLTNSNSALLGIQSCIVTYNLATASQIMATVPTNSAGETVWLYQCAFNLLALSFEMTRGDNISFLSRDSVWVQEYLLLITLCLWNMTELAHLLGRESDVQTYSLHFLAMREIFQELLGKASHRIAAAAA